MSSDADAAAGCRAIGGGSLLLTLMKARTFIALIAVIVFFSLTVPNFLSTANLHPDVEARGAERLPRHGHDLRHHHRRHRPVGRLDRRALRHGRRLSGAQRHRPADRLHGLFQRPRDHPDHARRRHPDRRDQRAADHQAQRRAVHRDARHALCRARRWRCCRRTAAPSRTSSATRTRHHRLRLSRRGPHPRPAGLDLDPDRAWRWARPISPRYTPLGRHIFAVGGNERARAHLRRARQHGQDVRLHVLRLLRGDRRPDHLLAS